MNYDADRADSKGMRARETSSRTNRFRPERRCERIAKSQSLDRSSIDNASAKFLGLIRLLLRRVDPFYQE